MKICPHCHTKYTDDTLKFCLQDGTSLTFFNGDQTLELSVNDFADAKTIADNSSNRTDNFDSKTIAFENHRTNENPQRENIRQNINEDSPETVTVVKQAPLNTNFQSPESELSFVKVFVIGLSLIALAGIIFAGFLFLPAFFKDKDKVVNKTNEAKVLTDTKDVKISASSTRASENGNIYEPHLAFDGNSRTGWCEGAKGAGIGQWIVFDFKEEVILQTVIIEPGYFKTEELWRKNNRLKSAILKFSNGTYKVYDFPDELKKQKLDLGNVKTKSVMLTIKDVHAGRRDSKDTLISEVQFVVK